ncbi:MULTISPECIES: DUF2235 domain-containing protein [unclassified Herbaspirillum]|uniref:T6SS phospholipase effector Tle1-like catalytic domain-containing protein n=1 Tax=unclassified Herbaspirillum TaxID=2624150 RepID=UPI000E2E7579|nr:MULTISPECIES: DUF2235 domain-containing protein [unclassified Herbaspirillum]RFB67900.1 DUF2235 domain-containing protein [Herbaspirillum sp. 3R-3a1]TFI06336.1 DUF2235 domain-containing protein [Herbaspirillum sp. 3R11]TFI14052.1 DUF2235 domain-containing protein [Herbaspirillum sp. 3R-11]TFI23952.1 DUF2235 domain-containing protein [Herbaspirillum sp. 3C11]
MSTPASMEAIQLTCPLPLPTRKNGLCDDEVNIGLFFDGTGNNKETDQPHNSHSNVARLYEAYKENGKNRDDPTDPYPNFYRYYIEGVGTECEPINDPGGTDDGAAFGVGGKARIVLGLLHVLNSLYQFVMNRHRKHRYTPLFDRDRIAALCYDSNYVKVAPEIMAKYQRILLELKLSDSLVDGSKNAREAFFREQAGKLTGLLSHFDTRPTVTSIYLDVVGFSRGAAEARVFANWLNDTMMHSEGKLFGINATIRFMGLFDTVAAVVGQGGMGSIMRAATWREGHDDWACIRDLQVPAKPIVQNCVHLVALHELRTSFPGDSVYRDQVDPHDSTRHTEIKPDNCEERIRPGSHSDLGGGYAPGEQGKGVDRNLNPVQSDDGHKLSQVYLNEMYQAALASCELHFDKKPWLTFSDKQADTRNMDQQFTSNPQIKNAIQNYFTQCGVATNLSLEHALKQHGLRYLAWRYQVNKDKRFEQLPSMQIAWRTDPGRVNYCLEGEKVFAQQVSDLEDDRASRNMDEEGRRNHREAKDILRQIREMRNRDGLEWFFDQHVHDSIAGFREQTKSNVKFDLAEQQRYVRYRLLYRGVDAEGNSVPLNSKLKPLDATTFTHMT